VPEIYAKAIILIQHVDNSDEFLPGNARILVKAGNLRHHARILVKAGNLRHQHSVSPPLMGM
jgi:hypothetical protein